MPYIFSFEICQSSFVLVSVPAFIPSFFFPGLSARFLLHSPLLVNRLTAERYLQPTANMVGAYMVGGVGRLWMQTFLNFLDGVFLHHQTQTFVNRRLVSFNFPSNSAQRSFWFILCDNKNPPTIWLFNVHKFKSPSALHWGYFTINIKVLFILLVKMYTSQICTQYTKLPHIWVLIWVRSTPGRA